MTLQQTDFPAETGLKRWGCMFMSLVVAAWKAALDRDPTHDEVMAVYQDCMGEMTTRWEGGVAAGQVPVLHMTNPLTYEIWVNNPTRVVEKALSYAGGPGWRGGQVPDADMMAPAQMPRDYRLTFTLLNFRRASADGHWLLGDRSGMNVLYNPDENLDVNWWSRSPQWRGVRVWRV